MKLVGKKTIISRAPITVKMRSSSYQRNTYRELDPINNVFPTLCYSYSREQTRCMQTCQLQHLNPFSRLTTSFTDLSKIQSHCNNKTTSTCGFILTSIKKEIIMLRVMNFLPMKISLFYLPFPLLVHDYLPVIDVTAPSVCPLYTSTQK